MSRLFWKIFLGYWLATVILIVLTAWVSEQIAEVANLPTRSALRELRAQSRPVLAARRALSRAAARIRAGELEGLGRSRASPRRHSRVRNSERPRRLPILIIDPTGREVLGRPLPGLPGFLARDPPDSPATNGRGGWLVEHASAPSGARYTLLAPVEGPGRARTSTLGAAPGEPPPPVRLFAPRHGPWHALRWVRLALALVVSGAVCYVLARYLAAPIGRLRAAAGRVAVGDLSVRVSDSLGGRRDEIAELAREFDAMTERLEKLLGARARLLRDVAHELRSPLARLEVALELARQNAGGAASAEHDRIALETHRLADLISRLMELERLDEPLPESSMEKIDLRNLVRAVADDARFEHLEKNVAVNVHESGPDDSLVVKGDREELGSALENVVRNACRYSPPDSPVEIGIARAGGNVLVTVRDRGPGVSEAKLGLIFDPFFRADDARAPGHGGHGLGLAIARRVLERQRGHIAARNVEGEPGLVVTLSLLAAD